MRPVAQHGFRFFGRKSGVNRKFSDVVKNSIDESPSQNFRYAFAKKTPHISVVVVGSVITGLVGAHLWRFRWCEAQLQAFAADDREPGHAPRALLPPRLHTRPARQDAEDAEALRKHLNEPPKGVTFVEGLCEKQSREFVFGALSPRPCVIYVSLDDCLTKAPDSIVKDIAEHFGVYSVFSYFAIRELFHFGPANKDTLLSAFRSVLDIIIGSLERLKTEYGHNYFPPVVVICGLEDFACASGLHSPAASAKDPLTEQVVSLFLTFCHEMSKKGLLHVVIPQRSGSSLRNADLVLSSSLRNADKIFAIRPMNKDDALLYLYCNLFTTHSTIPGDPLNRIRVFEKGEKMHMRHALLLDSFRKMSPTQTIVLSTMAEVLHANEYVLDKYVDTVHALATERVLALQRVSLTNDNEESVDAKLKPLKPRDTSDIITPELLRAAYRQMLLGEHEHLASVVLSTFLSSDEDPHSLLAYERKENSAPKDVKIDDEARALEPPQSATKSGLKNAGDTDTVDDDDSDRDDEEATNSSYQPSESHPKRESVEDFYDHLFDAKGQVTGRRSVTAPEAARDEDRVTSPSAQSETMRGKRSDVTAGLEPATAKRIFYAAKQRLGIPCSDDDFKTPAISPVDIKNAEIMRKNERIEALKGTTNAIVELTRIPMTDVYCGAAYNKDNRHAGEHDISVWQFVHDHLRGRWSILWYLLDNNVIRIGLASAKNDIDSSGSRNRDAVCFSQADASLRYVVQFASPIHRRIAEALIIDGGCDSLDEAKVAKSSPLRPSSPQLLKHRKHKSLANRAGTINVRGYGRGYNNELEEFQSDHILESTDEGNQKRLNLFDGTSSYESWSKSLGSLGANASIFSPNKILPLYGSCEKYDKSHVNTNILHGPSISICDSKLEALFDGGKKGVNSSPLYFLGSLHQSLVRACAVQMGLCEGLYPRMALPKKGQYRENIIKKGKHDGSLPVLDSASLTAYHLQRISSIHGAIDVGDIQEVLASQGYLHSQNRIELALDMLYLEGKMVEPRDLILSLDRLELEENLRIN